MAQVIKQQPKRRKQNAWWLFRNLDRQKCLRTIAPAGIEPSNEPVTSTDDVSVLATFCWTSEKTVRVPGCEPVFQCVNLPAVLPPAPDLNAAGRIASKVGKGGTRKPNSSNNKSTMPPYLFAPLAQAIITMSPSHRLCDTDLVAQRNSLRKLFALCAGRNHDSFRIGLHLIRDTLVITKDDKFAWHPAVTRAAGVGLSFENLFTKPFPGRESDQAHHRVVSYNLGDLRCVVQFEVDACYHDEKEAVASGDNLATVDESLRIGEKLRLLDLQSTAALPTNTSSPAPIERGQKMPDTIAPQSSVAEMKTTSSGSKLSEALPQLWFGRTPWLIQGRRKGDTITAIEITRAAGRFGDWEQRNQETLRRMVTLIRELREILRGAGQARKHCVLVYDKETQGGDGEHRIVGVYRSSKVREPLPKIMVQKLWGPVEAPG